MSVRGLIRSLLHTASRPLGKVSRGLQAVAFGLGDPRFLTRRTREHWDRYLFLQQEQYVFSGLLPWEEEVYQKYLPPAGTIGVIGCGAGRDLIELSSRGYRVEGVDLSPRAIEKGRQYLKKAGIDCPIYLADAAEFDFPGQAYDAFIFSYLTYSYIPGPDRRIALLQRLKRKLKPNGPILVTYHPASEPIFFPKFNQFARRVSRLIRKSPLTERDRFHEIHYYLHGFTKEEIDQEARTAELTTLHVEREREGIAVLTSPPHSPSP